MGVCIQTSHRDMKLSMLNVPPPLSSCAATGPNPQAGRPLQGPGAPRRDLPMDGTWAPIERGVTATSSKCPVFLKERRWGGEPPLPQMFQMLCQPVIIPATSLPPHCLHLCVQTTDALPLFPAAAAAAAAAHTASSHSLSLTHTHTHNTPRAVSPPSATMRAFESVRALQTMKKSTCVGDFVLIRVPARPLRGCWGLVMHL